MTGFVPVTDAQLLPEGERRLFEVQGKQIVLFNLCGVFYALDNRCPHRAGPLGFGSFEQDQIFCPMHGWSFDVKTGACLSHPEKSVPSYPVRIENGQIHVQIGTTSSTP